MFECPRCKYKTLIARRAKPGNIPFEQPTRYYLVINRKTAKALGVKITGEAVNTRPQSDRVEGANVSIFEQFRAAIIWLFPARSRHLQCAYRLDTIREPNRYADWLLPCVPRTP